MTEGNEDCGSETRRRMVCHVRLHDSRRASARQTPSVIIVQPDTRVRSRARVTRDDQVFDLSENQSTYIPLGAVHRLENPGDEPLQVIEVQSGSYLGEDDIVRIEDKYGRA